MRASQYLLSLLPLVIVTKATICPKVLDNPADVEYVAILPDKNDTTVRGTVMITSAANGTGVNVQVSMSGMTMQAGPYTYHIHQNPAPALNCAAAGGHFDPYNVTDSAHCDPSNLQDCQVGDLSGKHGSMKSMSYSANYADDYISTLPGTPAFIGDRSLVVHFANGTRVSCANFTRSETGSPGLARTVPMSTVTVPCNAATALAPTIATPSLTTTTTCNTPTSVELTSAAELTTVTSCPAATVPTQAPAQTLAQTLTSACLTVTTTATQIETPSSTTTLLPNLAAGSTSSAFASLMALLGFVFFA